MKLKAYPETVSTFIHRKIMTSPSSEEAVQDYYETIRRWNRECNERAMSDEEFLELYNETLTSLETRNDPAELNTRTPKKYLAYFAVGLGFVLISLAVNYKIIYSCLACNLQDYIYPGLRMLRKIFIPIISLFPSLTAMYHETCLIQNPFFAVADMDCWPCSSVTNIREVYKPKPVKEQQNAPFVYKTEQETITSAMLKQFYFNNKLMFDKESPRILTDKKYYSSPSDMFLQLKLGEKHNYIWEFNNMGMAIALRQMIPRPEIVPKFGQSTERYLIIDTSQELFRVPDTECHFTFILSLNGARVIELNPAEECKHQCRSLKVELKEGYLLWYNWWYWRPTALPSNGNSTYIAHVGSYC